MLKPIKTFFNYLQKNANTSNIFRLSNDLSMSDEVSASPIEGEGETFDDPLTDPLAIDEEYRSENGNSSVIDLIAAEEENREENNSLDNFVFVDIEKLKCKINSDSTSEHNKQKYKKLLQASQESDINGNSKELSKSDENDDENVKCMIDAKQSNITLTDDNDNEDIESKIKPSIIEQKCEKNRAHVNGHEVVGKSADSSFVISVTSSEPETDEVTDTSILLEEIRSDGSDSGLGSDTLRSISAIEKNLATLTPSKSSLKRRSEETLHEEQPKKLKQGINFGEVTVFYFPRCQGFSCVPTQGGSSLGMTTKHAYKKTFTLMEHAMEQRRLNRLKMAGNELNASSSSSDESKSDDEVSENSLSEVDSEAYGFLQPVTARQRRAILKAAGVRKIDTMEKDECRQLRLSREVCGCTCRSFCDPDTCECSLAGIKCQVDRLKPHEFPCGCTRDGCANVNGRIEFNPARVKTHFIHTIMRLELEKRQELSDDASTSVIQHPTKWWSQMRLQSSTAQGSVMNSNYNGYMYNNATSSQYPAKIPPISTMVPTVVNQESLDLHYAYRDDYANSLSLSADASGSFNNSNDYYTNYNYMSTTGSNSNSMFHTQSYQQTAHVTSYHQQSSFGSDCQYSNYTPTNNAGSYRIDSINEINGVSSHTTSYMNANYNTSMHSGATNTRITFTTPQPNQQTSQDVLAGADGGGSSFCTVAQSTEPSPHEQNENLSEIIKKSIVESVTA